MALTPEEKEEIRSLVKVATKETIDETFRVLGVDTSNFDHVKEFREKHNWTSRYRKMAERLGSHIIIAITTIVTGGIITAIWAYVTKR